MLQVLKYSSIDTQILSYSISIIICILSFIYLLSIIISICIAYYYVLFYYARINFLSWNSPIYPRPTDKGPRNYHGSWQPLTWNCQYLLTFDLNMWQFHVIPPNRLWIQTRPAYELKAQTDNMFSTISSHPLAKRIKQTYNKN